MRNRVGDWLMSNLIMMVGCPASGKSTVAKNFATSSTYGGLYVSRDVIRFSMVKEDEEYFSKEDEVFEKFVEIIQEGLITNERVYVDATNLNEKSRNKVLDKLNLDNVDLYAIVMKTPLEECLRRNALREGRECVPESAVRRMFLSMTNPRGDQKYRYKEIYDINA